MKYITLYLSLLTAGCFSVNQQSDSLPHDLTVALGRSITIDLLSESPIMCDMMVLLGGRVQLNYEMDRNMMAEWIRIPIRRIYRDLEVKYIVSWILHFGGGVASLVDYRHEGTNSIPSYKVVIQNGETTKGLFASYAEKSGKWCDVLGKRLNEPWEITSEWMTFGDFISQMARDKNVSFIVDPEVDVTDYAIITVSKEPQKAKDILRSGLSQCGLTYGLQGGVVYVFPSVKSGIGTNDAVVEKMKKIILPEVEFRQASVSDALRSLQVASVEHDTGSEPKGVAPFLNLEPGSVQKALDGAVIESVDQVVSVPRVTFSARNISLFDVLNVVCRTAGIQWEISGKSILFITKRGEKVQQPSFGEKAPGVAGSDDRK